MLRVDLTPIVIAPTRSLFAALAIPVQSCELNGEHVNPNNGNTTAGKTGRMRCRDGDGGPIAREEELKAGVFAAARGRSGEQPTGTHRSWNGEGHLRAESVHDDRGRLRRERDLDAAGQVVRDDEVFEDGSRKAYVK